jgi:hypothetical protein
MEESGLVEGMVLKGRFVIQCEIARTDAFTIYRAKDLEWYQGPIVVVVTPEAPVEQTMKEKRWLHHARLSDFGSKSTRLLAACKGRNLLCGCGRGFEHGVWYYAWEIRPAWIEDPYPFRRPHSFSKPTRRALLERANGLCGVCGGTESLQLDHIVPLALDGSSEFENGIVLCKTCHAAKTRVQMQVLPEGELEMHVSGDPPYSLTLHRRETHTFETVRDA